MVDGSTIDLQRRREEERCSEGCTVHAECARSDGRHFHVIFLAVQGVACGCLSFCVRQYFFLSRLTGTGWRSRNASERRGALSRSPETIAVGGGGREAHIGEITRVKHIVKHSWSHRIWPIFSIYSAGAMAPSEFSTPL